MLRGVHTGGFRTTSDLRLTGGMPVSHGHVSFSFQRVIREFVDDGRGIIFRDAEVLILMHIDQHLRSLRGFVDQEGGSYALSKFSVAFVSYGGHSEMNFPKMMREAA